jgi:iron complex transport system substrate-binding protein
MVTPHRIVSLISSATEILYLLGLGDRVVGVSHECDYPPEAALKPRLTRSLVESAASSREIDDQVRSLASSHSALYTIDVEQLAALAPDLIITQAQCDVCAVRYEDVVSAVRETPSLKNSRILALNPRSIMDVFDDVERIGKAVGDDINAPVLKARFVTRVLMAQVKAAQIPPSKILRAACLEWIDPPMLAANWMPHLIRLAGGEPGMTVDGQHSTYADWQQILDYDPQVIVIMPCGFDLERAIVEAQVLTGSSGWSELSAVREGRVFAVDGNAYFNRSGPRLVDSLEILAHLFHPKHFAPPFFSEPQQAWRRLETRGDALVPSHL